MRAAAHADGSASLRMPTRSAAAVGAAGKVGRIAAWSLVAFALVAGILNINNNISFHSALSVRHAGAAAAKSSSTIPMPLLHPGRLARSLIEAEHGMAAHQQAIKALGKDAALLLEMPPPTGQSSDDWRPYVMRSCLHSRLTDRFAPCLKEQWPDKLEVAEELVYPDFRIRLPNFAQPEHREQWLRMWDQFEEDEHDRCVVDRGWGYYSHQRGQNLVFRDVRVPSSMLLALGQWGATGCMKPASQMHIDAIIAASKEPAPGNVGREEYVAVLASPDSYFWVHFMDRPAHMVVQAAEHMAGVTKVVVQQPATPHVQQQYQLLPGLANATIAVPQDMLAQRLLLPCRTPLMHPYLSRRHAELMFAAAGLPRNTVSIEKRKVVWYLSRGDGSTMNGGRGVVNEAELLSGIRNLLQQRGKGEELRVFNMAEFPLLTTAMSFVHNDVAAIVGPHGSAFGHLRWAAEHTMVVEFWPYDDHGGRPQKLYGIMHWEEARMFGLPYWNIPTRTQNSNRDMRVDVAQVVGILRDQLGKPQAEDSIELVYSWT